LDQNTVYKFLLSLVFFTFNLQAFQASAYYELYKNIKFTILIILFYYNLMYLHHFIV